MSVCLSVCLSECLSSVCVVEPKWLKLQSPNLRTGIVHHESWGYPFNIRSKGQGHRVRVQKHISVEGDRVVGVILHSIECPSSSLTFTIGQHLRCRQSLSECVEFDVPLDT